MEFIKSTFEYHRDRRGPHKWCYHQHHDPPQPNSMAEWYRHLLESNLDLFEEKAQK